MTSLIRSSALALILLCSLTSKAQVGAGLQISAGGSQIDGDSWGGYNKVCYTAGGLAWFDFNERIGIQPEIAYGHRGSREVVQGYGQITLTYIDVPVLLRVHVLERSDWALTAEAGPSANFLLRARSGFGDLCGDQTSWYSRLNAEGHLGVSAWHKQRLGVFMRWSYGLTNLWALTPRPWMSIHYVSLGLRLAFIANPWAFPTKKRRQPFRRLRWV